MNTIVRRTPEEVKALWVAALRSGVYQQTSRVLHREENGEFCPLGVLYDLAVEDGGKPWGEHMYAKAMPPPCFERFLRKVAPPFNVIVKMNDADGATFHQIADYIENYRSRK